MGKSALWGALALGLISAGAPVAVAQAAELRLSHQWSTADVRHQVAQMIADDPAVKASGVTVTIFPSESLFKAREQYRPLSRGQLDMTVLPLSYSGGERPAFNLTLMPGLVKNHDHAARLNASPFMAEIEKQLAEDDVMVLVHGYLAGGFASTGDCVTRPEHVQGKQMRAAGKSFEQMLAAAGASIASMASSEIYSALQSKVLDAVNTSSESFVSFRLYEQVACFTPAGENALWFMYQPLLVNKSAFEALSAEQRAALSAAAERAEAFYLDQAKKGDAEAARIFAEAGVQIAEMTAEDFSAWREIARASSYRAFAESTPDGARLLELALSVE